MSFGGTTIVFCLTGFNENMRIGSEEAKASVCPQNRAYGSVHGSSRKAHPLRNFKPMRLLLVGSYGLAFTLYKPIVRVCPRQGNCLAERPAFPVGKRYGCRFGGYSSFDQCSVEMLLSLLLINQPSPQSPPDMRFYLHELRRILA